jgi:hypothetical protein
MSTLKYVLSDEFVPHDGGAGLCSGRSIDHPFGISELLFGSQVGEVILRGWCTITVSLMQ